MPVKIDHEFRAKRLSKLSIPHVFKLGLGKWSGPWRVRPFRDSLLIEQPTGLLAGVEGGRFEQSLAGPDPPIPLPWQGSESYEADAPASAWLALAGTHSLARRAGRSFVPAGEIPALFRRAVEP